MPDSLRRLAPLTGVVFAVLLALTFILTGGTPGVHDTGQQVITYYKAHHSKQLTGNLIGVVGVAFFLFFVASLRGFLRQRPGGETPSTMALAGATMTAIGGTVFISLAFALIDARNSISPGAAQAINILSEDFFWPFTIGVCVFGIGIGLAIVNSGALPKWLGWVAFALGIIGFTPLGFFSFIIFLPWSAAVGIMIFMRGDTAPAAGAGSGTVGPGVAGTT
jgi:hypothetical protein